MPIMNALKELMHFHFASLPAVLVFAFGIFAGAASVVKLIQAGLSHIRVQMICFIPGMMAGSLYAIVMGLTTMDIPQAPLNTSNFHVAACLIGAALVIAMHVLQSPTRMPYFIGNQQLRQMP